MSADGRPGSAYLTGAGPSQRWELRPGRDATIGRQPGADIWIDDAQVSRQHAVLRFADDGWSIGEDAPSSNGTYLNGQRLLARSVLRDGDQVFVGRTALVFHLGADPLAGPAAGVAEVPPGGAGGVGGVGGAGGAGGRLETSTAPTVTGAAPVRQRPASHVGTVMLLAGAGEAIALVGNGLVTYVSSSGNGLLRWVLPPAVAVLATMIAAGIQLFGESEPSDSSAIGTQPRATAADRSAGRRRRARTMPVVASVLAAVLVLGVGGLAVTYGARYAIGYLTGKETGPDHLAQPAHATVRGLTVTVEHVYFTAHFTRVEVTVDNQRSDSAQLPLFGFCTFVGADRHGLELSISKSQWTTIVAPGVIETGTITFKGQLPEGVTSASLSFAFDPITVRGIRLGRPDTTTAASSGSTAGREPS